MYVVLALSLHGTSRIVAWSSAIGVIEGFSWVSSSVMSLAPPRQPSCFPVPKTGYRIGIGDEDMIKSEPLFLIRTHSFPSALPWIT
ncbi:hypothetical protein OG21DRAFT_1137476 [Imleria badia]|nr:hypothetical protein OG21DRAFT_1137476 [Imleria badia]